MLVIRCYFSLLLLKVSVYAFFETWYTLLKKALKASIGKHVSKQGTLSENLKNNCTPWGFLTCNLAKEVSTPIWKFGWILEHWPRPYENVRNLERMCRKTCFETIKTPKASILFEGIKLASWHWRFREIGLVGQYQVLTNAIQMMRETAKV